MKITPAYFEFTAYDFKPEKKEIKFHYELGFENKEALSFTETIILPQVPDLQDIPTDLLDNLLQSLHLILGISYYKLYFPPEIKLNKPLSLEQAEFWQTVYQKGLGEFMYRNAININDLAKFKGSDTVNPRSYDLNPGDKALVGIGGGKDSIVALELLKDEDIDMTAFVVETEQESPVVSDVINQAGLKDIKIKRYLDKKIFEEHEDSYNGHVPISAVFAWLGLLSAVLYGYKYVVVGNEHSSNFGNIDYQGMQINHQWSKSAEFENLFQSYSRNYITPDITYFSPLRPFYEIRIVEMFTKYKNYFPYFTSCNQSFKVHKERSSKLWCGECPKCAFMFALLAAYMNKEEVVNLFGKNLYEEESLLGTYKDLLGFGDLKPFDCVGTFEETRAALYLSKDKFKDSLVVKTFIPQISNGEELVATVHKTNPSLTVPAKFRFLGIKKVLILGYGLEGKVTQEYLAKEYPQLDIGIADASLDDNYLSKQAEYDLVIKTPGIQKSKVNIQYTTATNIFFSQVKNTIIGITGSKGKSTTASLIYDILKEGGKKVSLLGNIGQPMLESLLNPISEEEIFVVELSSYQLDDIKHSPQVAVVLNLFPDHMDYHGSLKEYYGAKKNIINYQRNQDYFVYNPKDKRVVSWAKEARSKTIPFNEEMDLSKVETTLLGEHNKDNIKAAITVAEIFNIKAEDITKALRNFKSLPHRLELVGEFKGIKFYDDAISTTPESTIMAINVIENIETIMLGGQDRGYDFSELEKVILNSGIKNVVLFPDSGGRVFSKDNDLNILNTDNMEEAVRFAYDNTSPGKVCLLSTASPSYTLWKNFEAKGDEFQSLVKKLG